MDDVQIKQGIDTATILRVILRHKFLVLFVFLLFTGVVSYYSMKQPTVYRTYAILYFDNASIIPMTDPSNRNQGFKSFDLGYYEIILSTGLLNDRFREELKKEILKNRDEEYANAAIRRASTGQIGLRPYMGSSQFIEISASGTDPFLVKKIVEVGAAILKARTSEIDQEGLQNGIAFIDEQMENTKNSLEKTELTLQALQKKIDMSGSKASEGPLSKIVLMKDRLAELEIQIQLGSSNIRALQSQLDSLQKRMTGSAELPEKEYQESERIKMQIETLQERKSMIYQRLGAVASDNREVMQIDEQIAQLQDQYVNILSTVKVSGDNKITGDLNAIWKSVLTKKNEEELQLLILKGQLRLYAGMIKNFEDKHPNLLNDAIEINRLERSKQFLTETLNSLIKQRESFALQMYGSPGNLKIIDPAKNPSPIYRKVYTNIFVSSILGLLIGVALAFGLEYLDNTIKSREHITALTNLPVIGTIPHIDVDEKVDVGKKIKSLPERLRFRKRWAQEEEDRNIIRKKAMISQLNPRSFVSESYRTLRTNIQFVHIDEPLKSLLISSPGPGEGKTTTAINTAISFADMGIKVCLVDADIRKPKYHLLFEISEAPGLADIVLNQAEIDSAIQQSSINNLSILTAGADATDHSEIFSSVRMSHLMNELEKRFDMVIYDSSPILLLTDTIILSSRVDGVMMVLKNNVTEKQAFLASLTALKNVRTNIVGIVFNDFNLERRGYYKYAYQGYYGYYGESKGRKRVNAKEKVEKS